MIKGETMKDMNGLELLADLAKGTGAHVEFVDNISVLGRCDYENRVIYISADEDFRKQILILGHEVGHWLSYLDSLKNKNSTSLRRNQRETLAYEYGWRLLANLGLVKRYFISKEEWYDLNMPNFHNFDPDTKIPWT